MKTNCVLIRPINIEQPTDQGDSNSPHSTKVVRENYKTFAILIAHEGRSLPKHVTNAFDEYVKCEILAHGFIRYY